MTAPRVYPFDGPRGGEYYGVDLSDGRTLSVMRDPGDPRVWLGDLSDPHGHADNGRGGIGRIDDVLVKWLARVAFDADLAELYWALLELRKVRGYV